MSQRWAQLLSANDLGRFLADLRLERGLTQAQLADELGMSRRYIYEIESGKPSVYTDRLFATLRLLQARLRIEAEVNDETDVHAATDGHAEAGTHAKTGVKAGG